MIARRVNWLAVCATCIASYAVISNIALLFSISWFVGFLVGAVVALGNVLDRSGIVNRYMAYGAVALTLVLLVVQTVSDEARAVTSGACAGMLLVLGASFASKRLRR